MAKTTKTKAKKLSDTVKNDNRPQSNFAPRGALPTTEISADLYDLTLALEDLRELTDITNGSTAAPHGYGLESLIETMGYDFYQVETVCEHYLEKLLENPPSREGVATVFNYAPLGDKNYRAAPSANLRKIAALYGMTQATERVFSEAKDVWLKQATRAGYNDWQVRAALDFMTYEKRTQEAKARDTDYEGPSDAIAA